MSFQAISTTDGSDVTSGSPTVYYTIDGGTQGTGSGSTVHEGNGQWSYAPAQAETNGDHVAFTFVLSGAVSQTVNVYPVAFDPTDSVRAGLTALPNAAADAAGGLVISDAGGLDIDTMNSNVSDILTDTGTSGVVLASGAITSGVVATDAIDADALATDAVNEIVDQVWDEATSGHNSAGSFGKAVRQVKEGVVSTESTVNDVSATTTSFVTALTETTDDHYNDKILVFINNGLAGQSRVITDYDGTTKTVTFDEALTEAPANGDGFIILAVHQHSTTQIATAVTSDMDANSTQLAAIVADTGELQADWANGGRLDIILDATATQASLDALNDISVADVLTTAMTESYGTDGSAVTLAQGVYVIMQGINEFAISGTTKTVKKLDGSTTAYTSTLDDATSPTSITRAT